MRESCATAASLSCPSYSDSSGKTKSRGLEKELDAVDDHGILHAQPMPYVFHNTSLNCLLGRRTGDFFHPGTVFTC